MPSPPAHKACLCCGVLAPWLQLIYCWWSMWSCYQSASSGCRDRLCATPSCPVSCLCSGTAVAPFYGYVTCCSHNGEGGLSQAGVGFKPYTSCSHTIFRLLCSAGFKCHRSHCTQISAQRGPITCINKYSNKQCDMRTLFPPDPWFCSVERSRSWLPVGSITVHSQPQGQYPTHSRYLYLSTTSVGRHSHTPPASSLGT